MTLSGSPPGRNAPAARYCDSHQARQAAGAPKGEGARTRMGGGQARSPGSHSAWIPTCQ